MSSPLLRGAARTPFSGTRAGAPGSWVGLALPLKERSSTASAGAEAKQGSLVAWSFLLSRPLLRKVRNLVIRGPAEWPVVTRALLVSSAVPWTLHLHLTEPSRGARVAALQKPATALGGR